MLTIAEFVEEYSGAPIDIDELAIANAIAIYTSIDEPLHKVAVEYINAYAAFKKAVKAVNLTLG